MAAMALVDARFATYLAVSALLIMTPGPDTALVTRNALLAGRRAASYTTAGIGAGSVAWAAASVLGVAILLEQSAIACTVFKLAGAAYLGFLGLRSLFAGVRLGRHQRGLRGDNTGDRDMAPQGPPRDGGQPRLTDRAALRQGLASNLLNPKAGAIFATVLPQFIQPGDSPLRLGLMLLAYEAILLGWLNVYGALISRAGRSRFGDRVREVLGRATGAVLIALGIRLALEQR
jgi:threonine/homoserine/homoserine lactone efflux protein